MSTNPLLAFSGGIARGMSSYQAKKEEVQKEQRKLDIAKEIEMAKQKNDLQLKAVDGMKDAITKNNFSMFKYWAKAAGQEVPEGISIDFKTGNVPFSGLEVTEKNKPEVIKRLVDDGADPLLVSELTIGDKITKNKEGRTTIEFEDGIKTEVLEDDGTITLQTYKGGQLQREVKTGRRPKGAPLSPEEIIKRETARGEVENRTKLEADINKKVLDFSNEIFKDPITRKMNEQVMKAQNILTLIKDGKTSQLTKSALEVLLPRALGEVGNLAQQEQNKYFRGGSIDRRLKVFVEGLKTGTLPQESLDEVNKLMNDYIGTVNEGLGDYLTDRQLSGMSSIGVYDDGSEDAKKKISKWDKVMRETAKAMVGKLVTLEMEPEEKSVRDANTGTSKNKAVIGEEDFLKKYEVK